MTLWCDNQPFHLVSLVSVAIHCFIVAYGSAWFYRKMKRRRSIVFFGWIIVIMLCPIWITSST